MELLSDSTLQRPSCLLILLGLCSIAFRDQESNHCLVQKVQLLCRSEASISPTYRSSINPSDPSFGGTLSLAGFAGKERKAEAFSQSDHPRIVHDSSYADEQARSAAFLAHQLVISEILYCQATLLPL